MAETRCIWIVLLLTGLFLAGGLLVWLSRRPSPQTANGSPVGPAADPTTRPLRIALIPERDIFAQRRRYVALTDHLAERLDRPIEVVTLNTYAAVLTEFRQHQIDAAFLGSMVAVLAHERLGARVLVKPEHPDGVSTYRGVVFVREDSPIRDVESLAGRSVAMVRTTTAGNLFPVYVFADHAMLDGENRPRFRWVGTHDDVVSEVVSRRVDAGAAKDLRIDDYLQSHPDVKLRRLAVSNPVPENALLVAAHMPAEVAERFEQALLRMHETAEGEAALHAFGARRFLPCRMGEYAAVYEMVDPLAEHWGQVGVEGPAPRRADAALVPGEVKGH